MPMSLVTPVAPVAAVTSMAVVSYTVPFVGVMSATVPCPVTVSWCVLVFRSCLFQVVLRL